MVRLCIAAALIVASPALAETRGTSFEIRRPSIDAGAGAASGGDFSLRGVIGQPEASPPTAGTNFSLQPGFFSPLVPRPDAIFSDGFGP